DLPVYVAILLCLLIGAGIGAWQGLWLAYFNIPSFIVTLAGMLIFRCLILVVLNGLTLAPFPDSFRSVSSSFLPDWFNGSNLNIIAIVLGIVFTIAFIFVEINNRRTDLKYGYTTSSFPAFIAKLVVLSIVINIFTYNLSKYEGILFILLILLILVLSFFFNIIIMIVV